VSKVTEKIKTRSKPTPSENFNSHPLYAVHDYFKHAGGRDIFLLDWRQVLSYDVSFLNIHIVVNSLINLVNKNLPRTALQICMFHFNYNFTIIVPIGFAISIETPPVD
jgi:hypothetical protein